MKSFTKLYVLVLALLFSVGMVAQNEAAIQYEQEQIESQRWLDQHGPTIEVPPPSTREVTAAGDDCSEPILITLSKGMAVVDANGTTCGAGNDYSNSCMGLYDGGEDTHYELNVTEPMWVLINFDPVETYSGIAIKDMCGDGGTCLVMKGEYSNAAKQIKYEFTAAGTYYLMIDTWPSPPCVTYTMDFQEYIPPPPAEPITMFPFEETFDDCGDLPAEMQALTGDRNTVTVEGNAAFGDDGCGLQMAGVVYNYFYYSSNCQSGVNYNIPVNQGGTAYGSYGEHWSKIVMDVRPDANAVGAFQLDFDFEQFYSYSTYYNAFEVWINGMPIAEKETGETCFRTTTATGDGWSKMVYDLAPYANDTEVKIEIVFIAAYGSGYGSFGDIVYLDNVKVWYVPSDDLEGMAYNGDMNTPLENVEIGFLTDPAPFAPVMTGADGLYRFDNVPTEPINPWPMYAFLDGQNYIEADVMLETGPPSTVYNWNMASPLMIITPAVLEETMNPNEWRAVPISITNGPTGGPLHWSAEIVFDEPPMKANFAIANDPSTWSTSAPVIDQSTFDGSVAILGGAEAESTRDIAEYMDCTLDENLFSAPPQGTSNGQAFESFYGWKAGQHFTLDNDDPIGFIDFWVIATGTPTADSEILIEFWEDGSAPSVLYASFTAFLTPLATGEFWSGSFQYFRYSVELPEGVDLEEGWLTLQRQNGGAPNPIMYWANTTATSEPSWHSAGGSVGPYATCLGGGAGLNWLDLTEYEGDVDPGDSQFVNALFDATGTEPGQVWTADVIFTAQPNISTATVDVSMIIAGEPLVPVEEFTAVLANAATGQVDLAWTGVNAITFEYYLIRRDGAPIANTQNTSYVDVLPTYGDYCYTVSAVYAEGESVPAGPECVSWYIPELCTYDADPVYGEVWVGESETVEFTMENCGDGVLSFEFVGFDDPTFVNAFVTDVVPFAGTIAEGEMMTIAVTFDAANYGAGSYWTDLELMTNELAPDNERMIECNMVAYTPATFYGVVIDCNDQFPISNVSVMAMETTSGAMFNGETGANGYYEFFVDEGTYDITFSKLSYTSAMVEDIDAPAGVMTEVNAELCEVPYPVQWVHADPNEADTECLVTWSLPMGPYEIIYDDGTAENFFAWTLPGGGVGVKFTPAGYPATVVAGRLFVGDGTFPVGANFLGSVMSVGVMDDDGPNGMPGTILDSLEVTVSNYGWITFPLPAAAMFEDGDFYVVMWQTVAPPFGAPVGVDEQNPTTFRSRVLHPGADEWTMSAYNDFMIRATVMGPGDNVNAYAEGPMVVVPKPTDGLHIAQHTPSFIPGREQPGQFMPVVVENSADRDFVKYRVAFVDDFDPDLMEGPEDGQLNILGTTTQNQRNDNTWGANDPGFYAYAVQAMYESNNSIWVYSNVAAHDLDVVVKVIVTQCDGEEPSNAAVVMSGQNYPFDVLTGITPANGEVEFDSVIKGVYDLGVVKLGYQAYAHPDLIISSNYTEYVVLQEKEYPPRNLYVDPLTSIATWDEPINIQIMDGGFETEPFPPAGWQSSTSGIGWERTQNGSSTYWAVPPIPADGGEWYAVANDDQNSGNNGCCDYLITPECDLREAADYALQFSYFYNGQYGGDAIVEYSLDGGATWEELESLAQVGGWTNYEIDLSAMSGPSGESSIWFAFHYDDNGAWADGWALDNVYLANGPEVVEILGYHVYLDGNFSGATDADTRTFQYQDLTYGKIYVASVAALYGCNLSDQIYYTFTSGYLYPPRNLFDEYLYNTNEVPLGWNPPMSGGAPMGPNVNYPKYDGDQVAIEFGQVDDAMAMNRSTSGDVVVSTSGTRTVGDVLYQFGPNGMSLPWGCGFDYDEDFIYLTDPLSFPTTVFQYDYNTGDQTGVEFSISKGQAWIGDLAYYDGVLYCLMVGGPNSIVGIDIATGDEVAEITGSAWAGISQRGLGVDGEGTGGTGDIEFYTGGWNTNIMFHIDYNGDVISQEPWAGISGMAWHPQGGPDAEGSVWVMTNAGTSTCTEFDPMNAWANLQAFNIPGNTSFSGAGLAMNGDGNLWMPNQVDVQVYLVDTEEPFTGGGPTVPDGLLEFNVYRDLVHVGTVLYDGEGLEDTISFVDNPVDPGCYDYTVTAVYDLGVFGFPGQTGESMHEGPDTVCVVWGVDLPFMEMWDSGNFGFNGWSLSGNNTNWVVANQNGNDAPSAQFNWDPDPQGEYSLSMVSAPLKADLYTEGKIWLDFEYALANRVPTGDEHLAVEVYNGDDWFLVFSTSNMGNMDYTPNHIDISAFAMGRVFAVRFTASGMNSFDIINWNVDNIYIYRDCDAPKELYADFLWNDVDDYGAEIWWESPDIPVPPEGWVRWDNGTPAAPVGLAEGGDWSAAIRWDAGELADYVGTTITEIQFYMADDSFDAIKVKIWQGANASMLIHESDSLHPDSATWTTYTVDPPVAWDALDELWVGYTIIGQVPSTFPASMDAGPAITGYGDKISTDGSTWDNASDFGLNGNWNIAAYLKQPINAPVMPLPFLDTHVYNNNGDVTLVAGPSINGATAPSLESSRDFTGFNIYRMGPGEMEYTLIDNVPYEEGTIDYSYYDEDPYPNAGTDYEVCYQVTAVWESDTDVCESMPARNGALPTDDFVCVMLTTSIDNPLEGGVTALYPNPANDHVNVTSSYDISRITIVNYVGQIVHDVEVNAERSLSLNVATYDAGVYIVKIETDNGMVTKRLAITK